MSKLLNNYLGAIKKFVPEKQQGLSVGLDISAESCKMVEINKSGNEFELTNWAIEPIVDLDTKTTIKKVLGKLKIPNRTPFTAIFGKGTLIRYIDMPKMGLNDLKKSFGLEADKYFPFNKDQIYTDCYILDSKGKDSKMSVLVAASKRELIDERIKLLNSLGLQSDFVGLNPTAIANAANVFGIEPKGSEKSEAEKKEGATAVAILDMGNEVSNLMIMLENLPRFTRDIYIGGNDLTKRISNALGVGFEEADKLKCDPGDKMEEVLNASETALMNLITEIRLSFDYFTTEYNFHISKFLLTGGSSKSEKYIEFFAKHLDMQVERWDPLSSLALSGNLSADEVKSNSCRLGVALGLALYKYS